MKTVISLALGLLFSYYTKAQNVFPQKVEGCDFSEFCLDCGDPKATYDENDFSQLTSRVNGEHNFKGAKGQINFQVIVDSTGKGCVISHTDQTNNKLTQQLIQYLDRCRWRPAVDNNKKTNASINVIFAVQNDQLVGHIERVNIEEMDDNMSNPGEPEIYNKSIHYVNPSLEAYEITVYQKENSNLPSDMSQHCMVDKKDLVWCGTYNGFAMMENGKITRIDASNSPFSKNESISCEAVDSANNKWVAVGGKIYKYDNSKWQEFKLPVPGKLGIYSLSANKYGEVFACTDTGLMIIKKGVVEVIDKEKIKGLPSNAIFYALRDRAGRLWIGTFEGTVMVDENSGVTSFNSTNTPLKGTAIIDGAEDKEGNLYFALYDYVRSTVRDRDKEGFVKYSAGGSWTHYNDKNSGMPANHVNNLFYDRFENVLWIATNEAGLVRYDLKNGWENYHNRNSKIPSSYTFAISQDSKGAIYISTFNGMVEVHRK